MRNLKLLTLLGLGLLFAPYAHAQVAVGVYPGYVGPPPVCPYGYYDYYPYACAPYGYYGPSWFSGGIFIGAGPWGRGYRGFYGGRGFGGRGYYGNGRAFSGRGGFRGGLANGYAAGGGHAFSGGGRAFGGGGRAFGGGGGGSHGGGRR